MQLILFYEYVPDMLERRAPFREAHLALVRRLHAEGKIVIAGALQPVDGAILAFRVDAPAEVEAFVAADPYAQNGLVRSWRVREWAVVVGG